MTLLSYHVDQAIAYLTIDDPVSKVNVLSRALWSEFEDLLAEISVRQDLHGLIIESGKPGVFIAGADLKELLQVPEVDHPPTRDFIEAGLHVLESIENLPYPTIALVDGVALGGGLEVALACDMRIAGTHRNTRFGFPEVSLALIPGWGGTQRLPRITGATTALDMLLLNIHLDAESARYRGLVSDLFPSEQLRDQAVHLLQRARIHNWWQDARQRKRSPMEPATKNITIDTIKAGHFSDAQLNALSLSPDAFRSYRQQIEQEHKNSNCYQAMQVLIDLVEQGSVLPLAKAIALETKQFLRLVAQPEARQNIADFFQKRKK